MSFSTSGLTQEIDNSKNANNRANTALLVDGPIVVVVVVVVVVKNRLSDSILKIGPSQAVNW